ncbi:MAG: hypothetical protein A2958_00270 [Candidatus Levybacteria bacterium RIFCSPLOWO2_01_FULL_38_13]|nr:MAG: hypothetical protein A2629_02355 [Candidatus Levybacteria bacterium RIFCSPHIGHO2_01_FULL_41_15]OGH34971.1 MAG: hypothetical protein A2958_00270 [Candidatus Levybacteria bacterium RIFCSPLOWO2_01_FULL_38_13]
MVDELKREGMQKRRIKLISLGITAIGEARENQNDLNAVLSHLCPSQENANLSISISYWLSPGGEDWVTASIPIFL